MSSLSVQITVSVVNIEVNGTIFPNKLTCDYSGNITEEKVNGLLRNHVFEIGRYLTKMGMRKVTFQGDLENVNNATMAKVCQAMGRLGEALGMKNIWVQFLEEKRKSNPESFLLRHTEQRTNEAVQEYASACEALTKVCIDTGVKLSS